MRAVSFYQDNILMDVLAAQRAVFAHFGIEHEQVKTTLTHGLAIDEYLLNNDWTEIAIFDIDCIPLHKDVINEASEMVSCNVVYAAAQQANHIPNSNIYTSPAFCCFNKEIWENTNRATFEDIPGYDVGGYFSEQVTTAIKFLYPTHVDSPMWKLKGHNDFGPGTTYEDAVYHSFLSRQGNQQRFIDKCNSVING